MSGPGGCLNVKGNSHSGEVVELMGIMPTLLEAARLLIPDRVEGKSVLALRREETTVR